MQCFKYAFYTDGLGVTISCYCTAGLEHCLLEFLVWYRMHDMIVSDAPLTLIMSSAAAYYHSTLPLL